MVTDPTYWLASLGEQIANRMLGLDPETLSRLAALEGRVIAVEITWPELTLYLVPGSSGVAVRAAIDTEPDVTLYGTLAGFVRLSRSESQRAAFADGAVAIRGDTELAQHFARILAALEIDWEEIAAGYIGDIPARRLGVAVREARAWTDEAIVTLARDAVEYLQHEHGDLAGLADGAGVEAFMAEVDRLRADADRLDQRVRRLRER